MSDFFRFKAGNPKRCVGFSMYHFKNQIKKIRQNITDQTHPIDYYNPLFYDVSDDYGTLHVSTIG